MSKPVLTALVKMSFFQHFSFFLRYPFFERCFWIINQKQYNNTNNNNNNNKTTKQQNNNKKTRCKANTIKLVFSEKKETQLFKNTVSKTHVFTHVNKKTIFTKKCVIFGFGQFPLKPLSFCFFLVFTVLVKKIAKTDKVCTKMRFSPLPDTNSGRQFLPKNHFFFILLIFG